MEQIVEQVVTRDLSGIDIAYADLDPNMRSSFTLFIKDLASQLHERGKALTLTLPPPVLGPLRVDEEAYDWAQLGASADLIKIAPLRDQSTYRLSMPSILAYLSELVEPAKLVLMVTPYAAEKSSEGVAGWLWPTRWASRPTYAGDSTPVTSQSSMNPWRLSVSISSGTKT